MKHRNTFFDSLFYDVDALTTDEKNQLAPHFDGAGSLVVVPPAGSAAVLRHYGNATDFLAAEFHDIHAVVLAGVGCSVLGTAALARNVANAYGFPVAGIVSGYGAVDVFAEALSGYLFYGLTDVIQHQRRQLGGQPRIFVPGAITAQTPADKTGPRTSQVSNALPDASDINTLLTILQAGPPKLKVLVGHSKGDLLLDFALEIFAADADQDHPYFEQLHITTFGAVTDLPRQFKHQHQFIGGIDWLGGMNSRLDVPHTRIPLAWHHLNTRYPFHFPTEQVLRDLVPITD